MNRIENHVKSVKKVKKSISDTMITIGEQVQDLIAQKDAVASHIAENEKIMQELSTLNASLKQTEDSLAASITQLQNLK